MDKNKQLLLIFFSITLLIISIATLVALSIYIRPSYLLLIITASVGVLSYIYIIYFLGKYFITKSSTHKEKVDFITLSILLFMVIVMVVPIGYFINLVDQSKYAKYIETNEKSNEFAVVKKLANQNNVFVRLGNINNSWANTRLLIPDASGASLYLNNGYCSLNYDDTSSKDMKDGVMQYINKSEISKIKAEIDLAKLTIMVHEFGHCIDMKRDFISFNIGENKSNSLIVATKAIVPKARTDISDIESYLKAAQQSTLWKEVFADVYSLGYVYLHYETYANDIAQGIKSYRDKNSKEDPLHNSSCFIDLAIKSKKPSKDEDLIEWSDTIRESKSCNSDFY